MDETTQQNQTALRRPVVQYLTQQQEEKKERIKLWMGACMIIVAASIDLFEGLLNLVGIGEIFSTLISVCADTIFMIWFWMLGISLMKNPRALISMAAQAIIGLIPFLNTLPELTLGVIGVVVFTRMVDKSNTLGKLANMAQGKIKS